MARRVMGRAGGFVGDTTFMELTRRSGYGGYWIGSP